MKRDNEAKMQKRGENLRIRRGVGGEEWIAAATQYVSALFLIFSKYP